MTLCSRERLPTPGVCALCAYRTAFFGERYGASSFSRTTRVEQRASNTNNRPSRPPVANTSLFVGLVANALTLASCPSNRALNTFVSTSNIAAVVSALAVSTRASSHVHATSNTAFSCAVAVQRGLIDDALVASDTVTVPF